MKITVLRKMRYQNTFIYIMQFDYVFQYLFAWNGEIYQNNIVLYPSFFTRVLYRLGFKKEAYTLQQLEDYEGFIMSGAMEAIDKVIAEGGTTRQFKREKAREIQDIEASVRAKAEKPCQWQAIEGRNGEFYYQCLTHGMAVKMGAEGEKPMHDVLSFIQPEEVTI